MTFDQAKRAGKARVPIVVIGATAAKIGAITFKRIRSVRIEFDAYGRDEDFVELVDKKAGNSTLVCPLADIDFAPDCPDTLKKLVLEA